MSFPSVCLVVLDGWGLAEPGPGNAVSLARTPVFDELWERYPHTQLIACGTAVGLPDGQMGNSEVGHLNLGAGAVIKQDLTRIDEAVDGGGLSENDVLRAAVDSAERVHLIGLLSDGGVHSHIDHVNALCDHCPRGGRAAVVRARLHRRPRHLTPRGRALRRMTLEDMVRSGGQHARLGGRAATTPWTATAAGSG